MANVFLAYAREDAAFADTLADALKKLGVGIRSDRSTVRPGDDWEQALRENLNAADSVIVVLSAAADQSANTMFEIGAADALGKPIIAVRPAGPRSAATLPGFLARRQVLDASGLTAGEIADQVSRQIAA